MVNGFSRNLRNSASHCAPTAPSTTRWSQLRVTDIMLATSNLRDTQNTPSDWRNSFKSAMYISRADGKLMSLCFPCSPFFVVCRQQSLFWATHGQNAGLRRVNDSWKMLDAIHAQIGNSEGATLRKSRMFALKKQQQVMHFYTQNTFHSILSIYKSFIILVCGQRGWPKK